MVDYPANNPSQVDTNLTNRLSAAKEAVWFRIGVLQSNMRDRERALNAFERVLAVNPNNVPAMTQAGAVLAKKECYHEAIGYLQRAITADDSCGETWAVLAHCYVMTEDLQKAYQAYQSALSNMPNPRCPNLWYGIGLLYDRYGSLDNALEAFLAVLSISPDFERVDEVCFCIGIIYKEQQKFDEALKYFNRVVVASNPPPPLTRADGWYQIGHVHELRRDVDSAIEMYKQALKENPQHPKTLQNYGWLEHSHNNNPTEAIQLLRQSAEHEPNDGQTWYLLGRVYMSLREFHQAYDAYQQAVYRDCQNATFWCSIGVLYYQMNQRRDAMDAYLRAIGLNPYVSEVWYDLGTLYESCEQNSDAIHAYRQAARLAPDNTQITDRLQELEGNLADQPAHPTSQQQQSTQPLPAQMQPVMQNVTRGHVNPLLNRSIGPSMRQMREPPPQQRSAQRQPHTELRQRRSRQLPPEQGRASMEGAQERNGSGEMAPIPPIRHPNMSVPAASNEFSHHQRTSMPVPLSSPVQHGSHPLSSAGQHFSQPLSTQPSVRMSVAAPSHSVPQQYDARMQTSAALQHVQLKPLAHQASPHEPNTNPQLQHSRLQLPRLAHPPAQGKLQAGNQHAQPRNNSQRLEQPSSAIPSRDGQPQSSCPPVAPVNGPSEPRSIPQQQSTLSRRQPLPQIQHLSPLQPATTTTTAPSEAQRKVANGLASKHTEQSKGLEEDKNARHQSDDSNQSRLRSGERFQPQQGSSDNSRSLKVAQINTTNIKNLSSPNAYPSTSQRIHISAQENGLKNIKERGPVPLVHGAPRGDPNDVRTKENALSEQHGKSIDSSPERMFKAEGSPTRERDQRSASNNLNGHMMSSRSLSPDRLPSGKQSIMTSSPDENVHRTREEARPTQLPPLSLPKPNQNSIPSLSEVGSGKHPSPVSTLMGNGSKVAGKTSSLPPLSSRGPSTLGSGSSKAPKNNTHGISSMGSASSISKFGKGIVQTPSSPANDIVASSSLPTPLPGKKTSDGGNSVHVHRSPRAPSQDQLPSFKAISIPPHGYRGQTDSVPSPSSLPVLSALSARANHVDTAKSAKEREGRGASMKEGNSDAENNDAQNFVKGRIAFPKRTGDGGSRRNAERPSSSHPIPGMFRSSPAPKAGQESHERKASGKEERIRSPSAPPLERRGEKTRSSSVPILGRRDGNTSSKREGLTREDSGRTAKRPRLHESQEDEVEKSARWRAEEQRGWEDEPKRMLSNDMPPFRESKNEGRASKNSKLLDVKGSPSKEGKSGENERVEPSALSQAVNLPRLSNAKPKLGAAPQLSANTPLPSFRSERMNMNTSRSTNGSSTCGKQGVPDGSRSSFSFGLRSTPVSVQVRQSSDSPLTRNGDRQEYHSSLGDSEATGRHADEKLDSGTNRKSPRDEKRIERLANSDSMNSRASAGPITVRSVGEMGKKDEKPNRAEIRSSAT
ncbi:unnamed protein product [Agarophyton chilense]|eukprot:gb/GEZJ01001465.1/.p1 GENE.gb/GEZJ01001465.1/~~gb/GEZJ01001465.1/.p1  ORF type:complete len:1453 (-),score=231.16 gb/GEZJ01001465.1/:407-4765(-)